MGSKNRIAKYILPIILKDREEHQWYVEPFCGGCNSINKVDGNRIASDNNKYLIALYKALQEGWAPKDYYTKEEYYYAKANVDSIEPHLVGYIGFVCSFRGKFFNGYAGNDYKRKNGKIEHSQHGQRNNLLRDFQHEHCNLNDVVFYHYTYTDLQIPQRSIIYCDPPYQGTTCYKTGAFNHEEFWQWCRGKVAEGHKVFISEYDAPEDFICVWQKDINSNLSGETKNTVEKLFIHKSQQQNETLL